ncbi:hypothetical protein MPL3356_490072 [Mesorhizobium plurifarium]|uniref:Uncharacterized protein n=1 Tax=Mesorhizobium plurifarium TaxID=69974 RepID=A0A090EBA0_MESPL|nr:hypothetical protein MPL3356_490072 [Mesorhizobium plurifarium]
MPRLLVIGRRLAAPLKESVGHKAQMQKVCKPSNAPMIGRRPGAIAIPGAKIRPCHGNVGPAAVWQFQQQHWFAAQLDPAKYNQRPPCKGMASAGDRHRCRKILVTGSLKMFPSTRSTTSGCCGWWRTGSPILAYCGSSGCG